MSCSCDSFAAKARTRVELQTLTITDDDYGGQVENWPVLATVWAIVEPTAGREIYINGQLQSRVDAKITIRYQADLSDTTEGAKGRVVLGSRIYNVRAVRNLHRDMKTEGTDFQLLICVEGEPT